jgi:hypothetical protein
MSFQTISPAAIVHHPLEIPTDIFGQDSLRETIKEKILLEGQGEAVEISEEYPIPILMIVFDFIHRVSPEMVLRLKSGQRVLLFEHWGTPVLRDKDICLIEKTRKDKKSSEKSSEEFIPELIIDLGKIWQETKTTENELESIKKALSTVEKLIKPSFVTTLVGKAPPLLFLFTQHLLYGRTGEIWYQESLTHSGIRITQL